MLRIDAQVSPSFTATSFSDLVEGTKRAVAARSNLAFIFGAYPWQCLELVWLTPFYKFE